MYYTECKSKNKKNWGRPGNEARSHLSAAKVKQLATNMRGVESVKE